MAAGSSVAAVPAVYTLVIERIFDAPRELVFKAWMDPTHLAHWLGPQGFTGAIIKMDVRPGGGYRFHLHSAEGIEYWMQGIYQEILVPERFVRTCVWTDTEGNPTAPESLMTVTFEEYGGRTKLTFKQVFESAAARDTHRSGTVSALDRLAEYLATVR
jgi:uncharacterized protein YndB with AHSA1/START domain